MKNLKRLFVLVGCTTVLYSCTTDDVMMDETPVMQQEVLPLEDETTNQLSLRTGDDEEDEVEEDGSGD